MEEDQHGHNADQPKANRYTAMPKPGRSDRAREQHKWQAHHGYRAPDFPNKLATSNIQRRSQVTKCHSDLAAAIPASAKHRFAADKTI
jgi:hypothetical protein